MIEHHCRKYQKKDFETMSSANSLSVALLSNQSIEILQTEPTVLNAEYLQKKHQSFMDSNHSLDAEKLCEILGGYNAILQHYLQKARLHHELAELLPHPTD